MYFSSFSSFSHHFPFFYNVVQNGGFLFSFFSTVKIFGEKRKYLVYVCLVIKRCMVHDNC